MGFQAILKDGSIIAPGVEVLGGILKPRQANDQYRGTTGTCPHCQELRNRQFGTDNLNVQQALSVADLTVTFRQAVIDGDHMKRICHFAHLPGFVAAAGKCRLCSDPDLAQHAAAVQVIGRWAKKEWAGCVVNAEMQILVPGAPPVRFRPDVSVIDASGRRVACIEFQRSREAFHAFKARDELRCAEFGDVLWFFHEGVYGRSLEHRSYLADRERKFYKSFLDRDTGQLQIKPGERPAHRNSLDKPRQLGACSEESLLRAINPPERQRVREPVDIDPLMDLLEVANNSKTDYDGLFGSNRRVSTVEKPRNPLSTVTERVRMAMDAGAITPEQIKAYDDRFAEHSLLIGEIKRTLRRLA